MFGSFLRPSWVYLGVPSLPNRVISSLTKWTGPGVRTFDTIVSPSRLPDHDDLLLMIHTVLLTEWKWRSHLFGEIVSILSAWTGQSVSSRSGSPQFRLKMSIRQGWNQTKSILANRIVNLDGEFVSVPFCHCSFWQFLLQFLLPAPFDAKIKLILF